MSRPAVPLALALALACSAPAPEAPRREVLLDGDERPRSPLLTGEDVERQVGAEQAERVALELGLVDAPELSAHVNALGRRLARHARERSFSYEFRIVDQDAPNAFALPGGFIYVSRGLLALTSSEGELANVLAHEIVHVAERHAAARQIVEERAINPLMLPGIVLGSVLGREVGAATTAPFRSFNAPYVARFSREQERSADRGGQELASRAGYDPDGMAVFLRKLEERERLRLGHSRLPGFLDTHPSTLERVGGALAQAGLIRRTRAPELAGPPVDYLRRLDGLVVGESAAEGVFRDERFLHPDLDFSIRFPRGWRLVNSDLSVGAISPDRNVQIFLTVPTPGDAPAEAARSFLAEHGRRLDIRVARARELRIGPLAAYRIEATARGGRGRLGGQLTWIAHQDRVYRLTAVAPAGIARSYFGRAQSSARTFRTLTPEERESITELRLRVVEGRSGETLEELSARTGNAWSVQRTALANDHPPSAALGDGQLVKIARPEPYRPSRVRGS